MDHAAEDYRPDEPMSAEDLAATLSRLGELDVTVRIADILLDVCHISFDTNREKVVLHVHPDDVADVLRRQR